MSGFWLATQLRDNQYSYEAALNAMQSYRSRCPTVNTKGEPEEYTESEILATLKQAYDRPPRSPWAKQNGWTSKGGGPVTDQAEAEDGEAAEDEHGFNLTDQGVFHTHYEKDRETGKARPVTVHVCSPLEVLAYSRDVNSEAWGRLLKWPDADKHEHSWVVPMGMLVGDGISFRETLANGGLEVGPHPKLLVQYVMTRRPQRRILSAPQVGWLNRCFVTPEWVIPAGSKAAYQAMGQGEHFYRISGTLQDWTENLGKKCIGNRLLTFLVSCAFAAPLMRPLNVQGGGFALEGDSSIGKSTALMVAGSVWGGGGQLGFCRTFAATHAALESIAELHNDACLLLDEMALSKPDELQETIYLLSNGFGRSRNNRTLTGRRTMSWRLMILANGEVPPADHAARAGQKMRGGAEARLALIPADSGKKLNGKPLGIFEKLYGTDDSRVFAENLEAAARLYYGIAARSFLEHFTANWDETICESAAFTESFVQANLKDRTGVAPEIRRILRRCAIAGAAGEKVTEIGITGWPPGSASDSAIFAFKQILERRGGVEGADMRNAFEQVRGFISSQRSRFRSAEPLTDQNGNRVIERITNSTGYWKKINEQLVYLVDPKIFRDEVCHGYNYQAVAKDLRARGLLLLNLARGFQRNESVTLEGGVTTRALFVPIKAAIIAGSDERGE